MNKLPPLPFAVFDEFGRGADDRVQDYGKACAAAAVAAALAPVTKPTKHYQPQRWPFALQPADDGRLEAPVRRRVRRPLKVPKYTMAPSRDWTESAGLRRAVAVLKTEASLLRREGFDLQPKALLRVAAALAEANRRGSTTGEAYALDWVRRDEATAPDDDA